MECVCDKIIYAIYLFIYLFIHSFFIYCGVDIRRGKISNGEKLSKEVNDNIKSTGNKLNVYQIAQNCHLTIRENCHISVHISFCI